MFFLALQVAANLMQEMSLYFKLKFFVEKIKKITLASYFKKVTPHPGFT